MINLTDGEKETLKFMKSQGGSIGIWGLTNSSKLRKNIFSLLDKKKITFNFDTMVATIKILKR